MRRCAAPRQQRADPDRDRRDVRRDPDRLRRDRRHRAAAGHLFLAHIPGRELARELRLCAARDVEHPHVDTEPDLAELADERRRVRRRARNAVAVVRRQQHADLSIDYHIGKVIGYTYSEALLYPRRITNVTAGTVTSFIKMTPIKLFRGYTIDDAAIFKDHTISYPVSLERALIAYRRAHAGFPTYLSSDHFGRMMYLSATTITTLGYGDIQPITPLARLLTSIEAVGGIVVIGLFLNALAVRASANKESS